MLKSRSFYLSAAIACVVFIALAGCIGGKSQPSRFYTLTSVSEGQGVQAGTEQAGNVDVGIGPVKVADYLNQNRIVTHTSTNRIDQAEFDQWTGSFKDNLTNVLAENIGYLLGSERISIYPWRSFIPIDYQVTVDIVRCDGQLGKEVVLVARWNVLKGKKKELSAMKRSDIRVEIGADSYEALVAAQSRALAKLSSEIVQAIQTAGRK
jgi:uncharacterized lipoprotein YmbA